MSVSIADPTPGRGLLLVGLGSTQELVVLEPVASRLATAEPLNLRMVNDVEDPDAALTALAAGETAGSPGAGRGWVAALPVDPGLPLGRGGSWVEALGAWRQPCLLVVQGEQMTTGLPAAGAALLERWRVPLVGLIQVGGPWRPEERRRDGLAWLGWLPPTPNEDPEALAALQLVLQSRRRRLEEA